MQKLQENDITPVVVIHNWDIPKNLHQIGGWTNSKLVTFFVDYAKTVLDNFADVVPIWLTFHDPYSVCMQGGWSLGMHEYTCMHNILKAHAEVYRYYKNVTSFGKY